MHYKYNRKIKLFSLNTYFTYVILQLLKKIKYVHHNIEIMLDKMLSSQFKFLYSYDCVWS